MIEVGTKVKLQGNHPVATVKEISKSGIYAELERNGKTQIVSVGALERAIDSGKMEIVK